MPLSWSSFSISEEISDRTCPSSKSVGWSSKSSESAISKNSPAELVPKGSSPFESDPSDIAHSPINSHGSSCPQLSQAEHACSNTSSKSAASFCSASLALISSIAVISPGITAATWSRQCNSSRSNPAKFDCSNVSARIITSFCFSNTMTLLSKIVLHKSKRYVYR